MSIADTIDMIIWSCKMLLSGQGVLVLLSGRSQWCYVTIVWRGKSEHSLTHSWNMKPAHQLILYVSNGLNLLHPRKDVAEMVIAFCVSLIVPEDLMFTIKSGKHVLVSKVIVFCVTPIVPESFMIVSSINVLV